MNEVVVATMEKIKDAIVSYAKRADGPVRPSEIARSLGVDPRLVRRLCEELIREGCLGTKPKGSE